MEKTLPSRCRLGVSFGKESFLYSFPNGHPLNASRISIFSEQLKEFSNNNSRITIYPPEPAKEEDLFLFHTKEYVKFVKECSKKGAGFLDYGDTPAFPGVFEASLMTVGGSLQGLAKIDNGSCDHFFNPVGGLHHATRERAGGFCVFNDSAVTIEKSLTDLVMMRVAYVDIDAHHGYTNTTNKVRIREAGFSVFYAC